MNVRAFSLFIFGIVIASAANAEEPAVALEDTVVTATRTSKVVSEAPASVSVVTSRDIETRNVQRIDEALRGTPGVFMRSLGTGVPDTWNNQITLRGIPGYYRTGVLVDGVAINNAFSGGTNLSIVPIDDVSQIEVVPGPFSSLYGGAGMAGIVNIITKTPDRQEVSLKGEGGSHDFRSVDFGYRDKLGDHAGVSLAYGHKQSGGYVSEYVVKSTTAASGTVPVNGWESTTTTTGTPAYIVGDKGARAWEMDNYVARLFLNFSPETRLVVEASFNTSEKRDGQGSSYLTNAADGTPFASGAAIIDGRNYTVRVTDFIDTTNGEDVTRYVARLETSLPGNMTLKADASVQESQYWYTTITASATNSDGPGTVVEIPNTSANAGVQLGMPIGSAQYLVTGLSSNKSRLRKRVHALASWRDPDEKGAPGDWANGDSTLSAVYVQDEIAAGDSLTVYLGARYDRWLTEGTFLNGSVVSRYDSRSKSAVSPKASLVYRVGQGTVVKGAVGKAFRAPNLSDMYSTFGTSTIYWSNPDLNPEKTVSSEIGVEHQFSTATTVRATIYHSDVSDLIYTSTSGSNRYKYNAGKARIDGIDMELRRKLGDAAIMFVTATHVTSEITENPIVPESEGKQIPLQPQETAGIGMDMRSGSWSGSIIGSYVGRMFGTNDNSDTTFNVPGAYDCYFVANAKVSYRFQKGLSASLAVSNALDRKYYTGSTVADRRTYYLGLNWRM